MSGPVIASPTRPDTVPQLIRAVAGGDAEAFARLYDETAPRVLGLVSRVLGPGQVAYEVTARVYEAVWLGDTADVGARPEDPGLAWLLALARRRAVAQLRGRVPVPRHGEARRDEGNPPAPFPPDAEWMPELTEHERDVLSLVYLQGATHAEADRRLGLSQGKSLDTLHFAMLHLARLTQDAEVPA